MQVEDVDGLYTKIPETPFQLIGQVLRRHAMAARCDFFGLKNAAIQKFAREILVGIGGHFAIRRQESSLRAEHQLVPVVTLCHELTQCRSDRALAPLEAVVDGRIDHVHAAFHGCDDCLRVTLVGRRIGLAEIRPYTDG